VSTCARDLGVEAQEDLMLIEAQDLFYLPIEDWVIAPFIEKFPLEIVLPELTMSVAYSFTANALP
ncbi:hypothetical protein AC626_12770, partial [Pseudoalteromonas rubra]